MKHITAIILLILGSCQIGLAKENILWGKLEAGMHSKEILALYPEAQKNKHQRNIPDYRGSRDELVISSFPLSSTENYPFKAVFWLNEYGLQKIELTSISGTKKQKNEILISLEKKYGTPSKSEDIGDLIRREWVTQNRLIRFEYTNKKEYPHEIGIYYFDTTHPTLIENL